MASSEWRMANGTCTLSLFATRYPLLAIRYSPLFSLHPEQLAVARLDLFAHLVDAGSVLLHGLDLVERLAAGLLLGRRMHRAQSAEIDDQLLAFRREAVALEQPRRIRVGRVLENSVGADDGRDAFGLIDHRDRSAGLLDLEEIVLAAVRHDGALAERKLLGRIGGGLHL